MTKFAFQFPAKFVFAESNIESRKVDCDYPLYSFDKQNVYFCSKKEKVVSKKQDYNCYFMIIEDHLVYCGTREEDSRMTEMFNQIGKEGVERHFDKFKNWILNPDEYQKDQAAKREKARLEREELDREQKEQTERRAKAAQEAFEKSLDEFKKEGYISWENFERACKENGINLPIKTVGFGRKYVTEVSHNSYRSCGKNKSTTLFKYVYELKERLS